MTGTFKNCIITYPLSHNNHHILRCYEWDLLVFCKQTSFSMAAIETLVSLITFFRKSLIKFYFNSQQMSDFFYYITEASELI